MPVMAKGGASFTHDSGSAGDFGGRYGIPSIRRQMTHR